MIQIMQITTNTKTKIIDVVKPIFFFIKSGPTCFDSKIFFLSVLTKKSIDLTIRIQLEIWSGSAKLDEQIALEFGSARIHNIKVLCSGSGF